MFECDVYSTNTNMGSTATSELMSSGEVKVLGSATRTLGLVKAADSAEPESACATGRTGVQVTLSAVTVNMPGASKHRPTRRDTLSPAGSVTEMPASKDGSRDYGAKKIELLRAGGASWMFLKFVTCNWRKAARVDRLIKVCNKRNGSRPRAGLPTGEDDRQ